MAKHLSYGVLIFNEHTQLLLAHVTGNPQWDIPKGGGDPGESAQAAALRETQEETGLVLVAEQLEDLGVVPYLPTKDLYCFSTRVTTAEVDVTQCVCTSHFKCRKTGVMLPEMDGFRWADIQDLPELCTERMARCLTELLPRVTAPA